MNSIFIKLIGAHFLVSAITIIVTGLAMNNETYFLVTAFSCILYLYSGYKVTNFKSSWINYFGVFAIGFILWLISFALSPDSLNYKSNNEAGFWFVYQLYIIVNSPLNFIDFLNEPFNLKRELLLLFFTPFIISLFQFFGGIYKIWEMKQYKNEKLQRENHFKNNIR